MKLLADENIDAAIVDWLRSQGVDTTYIAEFAASASDDEVLLTARMDDRVLITSDLDFGEMVFRRRWVVNGLLLLRYRGPTQTERLIVFRSQWTKIADRLEGRFTVATDRKIRIRPLPRTDFREH